MVNFGSSRLEVAVNDSTMGQAERAAAVLATPAQDEPARVLLHMPVDVRSISLAVLATLACIFALRWASAVFIPLLLGLTASYALNPAEIGRAHV